MNAPKEQPDKADVQRLAVYGYRLKRCRHLILEVGNPAKARSFVAQLCNRHLITDASIDDGSLKCNANGPWRPMNIGFTYRGLEALDLPTPYLRVFQEKAGAYAEGAYLRAAKQLADTGPNAAQCWDACFRPDCAHALLSMYADEGSELSACTQTLRMLPGADGWDGWERPLDGRQLGGKNDRRVHFGFRDGISNPAVQGFGARKAAAGMHAPKAHAAGEFLLGYPNDEGFNPWLLTNPGPMLNPWLLPSAHVHPGFFRNATFAALRKIEQDEKRFNDFVLDWATRLSANQADIDAMQAYVRAKLLGRWDDGRVVKPPSLPAAAAQVANRGLNDFDFSDDPKGEGCPFGAHIRRMNPRADPVVPFRKRPLMRRGMPYGPAYNDDTREDARGLLGLFFCASLEDQFEHLLGQWADMNPLGPFNRGKAKDPLIGSHDSPRAAFDIPMPGEALRRLDGFTPFVTTRGTLYAFYPSLRALAWLARIDTDPR